MLEKLWGLIRLVVADDETHFARAVAFAVGVDDVFDPSPAFVSWPERLDLGELWNVVEVSDVDAVEVLYFDDLSARVGPEDPDSRRHGRRSSARTFSVP